MLLETKHNNVLGHAPLGLVELPLLFISLSHTYIYEEIPFSFLFIDQMSFKYKIYHNVQ